tara:strand:- start:386 stop:997 length:612 start_codon:yes stop_codon:yes gene_type:complete
MGYFFQDLNNVHLPEHHQCWQVYVQQLIPDDIMDVVDEYVIDRDMETAGVVGGASADVRRTQICWLQDGNCKDELLPVYNYVSKLVRSINDDVWNFSIKGWEAFQYGVYDEEYLGHYDWHMDISARQIEGLQRKVSFSIGLTDKDSYEGGDLDFMQGSDSEYSFKLGRGDIVVFPSFLLHRVTPVTSGCRKSLVGWGLGPNFV